MKKRILAALCAALLCLTLLPALAQATGEVEVYQLVVNDDWFDKDALRADTMPISIGGTIYVPYTVFDKDVARVDFKISYGQKREGGEHTLTLYSLNGVLVFDLVRGTASDGQGNSLNMHAVLHNGKPFIPANAVCQYFNNLAGSGITLVQYVYNPTEYGTIIRLRNDDAVLEDVPFRQSALGAMKTRYNNYLKSLNTANGGGQTPATPVPSSSAGPNGDDRQRGPVYLAFYCGEGDGLAQILTTLDSRGLSALFLFRPEDLQDHADLVRRIVGTGYPLGLIVPNDSPANARAALEAGNAALERIAWTRTRIALPDGTDPSVAAALEDEGWHCWSANVSGRASNRSPAEQARRIFSSIEARQGAARVSMDDTAVSSNALSRLLNQLKTEEYGVRAPVETEL